MYKQDSAFDNLQCLICHQTKLSKSTFLNLPDLTRPPQNF